MLAHFNRDASTEGWQVNATTFLGRAGPRGGRASDAVLGCRRWTFASVLGTASAWGRVFLR